MKSKAKVATFLLGIVGLAFPSRAMAYVAFAGVSERVTLGTNSALRQSSEITYSFWARIPVAGGGFLAGAGASGGQGFGGIALAEGAVDFYWTPSNPGSDRVIQYAGTLSATIWHHIAMTFNFSAGTYQFYLDGAPVSTSLGGGAVTTYTPAASWSSGQTDAIGGRYVNGWQGFVGDLDDFRVFSKALTASEIEILGKSRTKNVVVQPAYLVGHWRLEEFPDGSAVAGQQIKDSSGTANNGSGVGGMFKATDFLSGE